MTTLYEKDFHQWTTTQSVLLKKKDFSNLDILNLIEEIDDLGKSTHSKMRSHLTCLFCHLLKIKYQPDKHTRSWDISIKNSIMQAKRVLKKNPSLKHFLEDIFKEAYEDAIPWAEDETGLDEDVFPKECPWSIEEIIKESDK